jgi:hypothetical protein
VDSDDRPAPCEICSKCLLGKCAVVCPIGWSHGNSDLPGQLGSTPHPVFKAVLELLNVGGTVRC